MHFMEIDCGSKLISYTLKKNLFQGLVLTLIMSTLAHLCFIFPLAVSPPLNFLITSVIDSTRNPCRILMNSKGNP